MLHPLVGLVAGTLAMDQHRQYDRMQEKEADVLDVQLACAAGYDPAGILAFVGKVNELAPGTDQFSPYPSIASTAVRIFAERGK